MAEHRIAILNRIAVADAGIELVCNNPTDTIRFEFDEEWSGIAAKTARFSWDGKYIDVPFSGNVVIVPEIYQTNYVHVGVFADNITSTPAKVKARFSIKCLGGKVVPPSEDVYAQIIALINAGINANDGVGVSSAYLGEDGHLFIVLTTGESIDCGMAKGKDGKDGKDGAGAEEFAAMQENLNAFEKDRPFNLTGNPVQVETFEGMPLNPVTVLEPAQEGSGDPSPENIRPFIGWDAVNLNAAGKNLLPNTAVSTTIKDLTYTVNDDGTITVKGTCTSTNALFVIGETMLPAGDYVVSGDTGNPTIWVYVNGERIYTDNHRFTLSETASVKCPVYVRAESYDTVLSPMIRLASETNATYEPYQGKLHTVQIGQTVYGGKMNWLTGRFRAEWWGKTFNGTEGLTVGGNGTLIFKPEHAPVKGYNTAISSHYPGDRIYCGADINFQNALDGTGYDTWAAFTAAQYAAGTPVQVVWPLASPVEIQLEPHEILALQGVNTLYGDGEITISGRSDMQAVVSNLLKRIAELEAIINS